MDKIIKITWKDHDGSANSRIFEDKELSKRFMNGLSEMGLSPKSEIYSQGMVIKSQEELLDDLKELYKYNEGDYYPEEYEDAYPSLEDVLEAAGGHSPHKAANKEDTSTTTADMEKRKPVAIKAFEESSEIGSKELLDMSAEVLSTWYDMKTPGGIAIYKLNTQFMKRNIPEAELILEAIEGLKKCIREAANARDKRDLVNTIHNLELLAEEAADYESDEE